MHKLLTGLILAALSTTAIALDNPFASDKVKKYVDRGELIIDHVAYKITKTDTNSFEVDLREGVMDSTLFYVPLNDFLKNRKSSDTITFMIHNMGGSVDAGAYIFNAIKETKAQTISVVDGPTYSMGAILACSTQKIEVKSTASLMYHSGSGNPGGNTGENRLAYNNVERLFRLMYKDCVIKKIMTEQQVTNAINGYDVYIYAEDLKNGNKSN